MTKPLDDVTVIEIDSWMAAPSAGAILSDLGARVIKIEPLTGDPMRNMSRKPKNQSDLLTEYDFQFDVDNRGKESLLLDITSEQGRKIVYELCENAQVFMCNLLLKRQEKYGFDAASLREVNAKLVHATLTGYGTTGPEAWRPGYDVTAFFGRSGLYDTIVENLQVYSTYDDGIEMFGGSVNFTNFVGVYVRDDSIDIDEGYNGTINNALVIQSAADGNHCIESDGLGSFSSLTDAEVEAKITQGINSAPTITNLTCIISPNETGTHDPGAGWRLREGIFPTISDSMIISSFGTDSSANNYCLRIDNRSSTAAADGDLVLTSNLIACEDQDRGTVGAQSVAEWASANGNQFAALAASANATATADTGLVLLEGTPSVYSVDFASMVIDDAAPSVAAPASGQIGGITLQGTDWARGWTYGIFEGSRAQPLWFE